jgi:hypothetical protein
MVKGDVYIAEEARPPPRILLGFVPGVPGVGVDDVCGIGVEVRRQVPPPALDLGAPTWLALRHGWDGHPEVAETPAAMHVHVLLAVARRQVRVHEPCHADGQRHPVPMVGTMPIGS